MARPAITLVSDLDIDPEAMQRQLVERVAAGDAAAFEVLFRMHYHRLAEFAWRLTGRHDVAEEIAGDALDVLWRQAGGFRGDSRLSTWLFAIAYRLALKARGRIARRADDVVLDEAMPDPASGEAAIEAVFLRAEILRALDALTPDHRAVIELTYYHGLDCGEVAIVVGCPVGTVKTRMMHARARLRRLLAADHAAPDGGGRPG